MIQLQKKEKMGWRLRLAMINEIITKIHILMRMEVNVSDVNAVPRVDHSKDNITIILPDHNQRFRDLERRVTELEDS